MNFKKSVVMPLGKQFTPELANSLRDFLAERDARFHDAIFTDAAPYLGIVSGPSGCGEAVWLAPLGKSKHRTLCTFLFGMAPSIGTDNYNTRILTTQSYVWQLVPPPPAAYELERWAIYKILHIPFHGIPRDLP